MKNAFILLGSIVLLTTACKQGNSKENSTTTTVESLNNELEKVSISDKTYSGKLDELLTLNMAAEIANLPPAEAKKDYRKSKLIEELSYEWPSDRTMKMEVMKGHITEAKITNSIKLSELKTISLSDFKKRYHNPTQEELNQTDDAVNKKLDEMEADGKATKNQTKAAGSIVNAAMSKFSVEEVASLGDYAVFVNTNFMGAKFRDLKVHYRGIMFSLEINLSDDKAENDKKAIECAKKIISGGLNN